MERNVLAKRFQGLFNGGKSKTHTSTEEVDEEATHNFQKPRSSLDKFQKIAKIGEGSYGRVFKARNRETGQIVAIKRFIECEDDALISKVAFREVSILKMLKHPNIISLLEVFKCKRRVHLVFEFCETNLLDQLDIYPRGYPHQDTIKVMYQILDALHYIHSEKVIYRDPKPDNILLTKDGVVKLCDFGFSRTVEPEDTLTAYVASRWYRAPELLVGGENYGPPIDIWGVGCIMAEMLTGEALWMGHTDVDQLFQIRATMGDFLPQHMAVLNKQKHLEGVTIEKSYKVRSLRRRMPSTISEEELDFLERCLDVDPSRRWTANQLLRHNYFKDFTYEPPLAEPRHSEKHHRRVSSQNSLSSSSISVSMLLPQLPSSHSPAITRSQSTSPSFDSRSNVDHLPNIRRMYKED